MECLAALAESGAEVARISGPTRRRIRSSLQFALKNMLFSSRRVCHVPCSVLCSTIRLGRAFFVIITRRGFVILRPTRTIIDTKRRFPQNLRGVGGAEWS